MPCKLRLPFTCLCHGDLETQHIVYKKRVIKSKSKFSIFVSLNSNLKALIFLPNLNWDLLKQAELELKLK